MFKRSALAGTGVALVLALCASAQAQETKTSSDLWTMLMAGPEEISSEQGQAAGQRGKDLAFTLGFKMEQWEAAMYVTDVGGSINGVPDPGFTAFMDDALEAMKVLHSVAFLIGEYTHQMESGTLQVHLGLGFERMGIRYVLDLPPPPPFVGEVSADNGPFDQSFIFEIGGGYTHRFKDRDVTLSILYRSGDAELDYSQAEFPDVTEEYEYTFFRISVEVGQRVMEGVQLFFQQRYTMYESTWTETGPSSETEVEMEMDQPLGTSLGVDLSAGVVKGRFELMFFDVEDVGFALSAGVKF